MIEFKHVFYSYENPASNTQRHHRRSKQSSSTAATENEQVANATWALKDITLTIHDGSFVGIAGHTGSGKSTLIQHMNGLIHPLRGAVYVDGNDIAHRQAAIDARKHIGLVFQYPEHQLFAETVHDDVAFGPRNHGLPADEVEQRVAEALESVNLDPASIGSVSPFELSGGQQRRVAFAGVLAMRPDTLILDEPMAGLDPAARQSFLDLIASLHKKRQMTIVMVSHNMNDLAALCDRIVIMNHGQIYTMGTPEQVFSDASSLQHIGLDVPDTQRFVQLLKDQGINLAPHLYSIDSLADAIAHELGAASMPHSTRQDVN